MQYILASFSIRCKRNSRRKSKVQNQSFIRRCYLSHVKWIKFNMNAKFIHFLFCVWTKFEKWMHGKISRMNLRMFTFFMIACKFDFLNNVTLHILTYCISKDVNFFFSTSESHLHANHLNTKKEEFSVQICMRLK